MNIHSFSKLLAAILIFSASMAVFPYLWESHTPAGQEYQRSGARKTALILTFGSLAFFVGLILNRHEPSPTIRFQYIPCK